LIEEPRFLFDAQQGLDRGALAGRAPPADRRTAARPEDVRRRQFSRRRACASLLRTAIPGTTAWPAPCLPDRITTTLLARPETRRKHSRARYRQSPRASVLHHLSESPPATDRRSHRGSARVPERRPAR